MRHALCHRAGVPAIREPLRNDDLWDWSRMAGALAATAPWWEPGTRHAYHTNTYGHLIGEVVRRVSGEACGRRLAALAGPLGADVLRRVSRRRSSIAVPRCSSTRRDLPPRWTTRWRVTPAWRC